jgi:hypothetical protein
LSLQNIPDNRPSFFRAEHIKDVWVLSARELPLAGINSKNSLSFSEISSYSGIFFTPKWSKAPYSALFFEQSS